MFDYVYDKQELKELKTACETIKTKWFMQL